MINIDELRQRVEAAEQRFGMIDSSQRQSSEKLIGMMNAIEQDQAQKQIALEESKALVASMAVENQQLRSMLHSLLLATEAAGNLQSAEIMREIDDKLTVIVEAAGPTIVSGAPEASEAGGGIEAKEPVEAVAPVAAEVAEMPVETEPDLEAIPSVEPAAVLGTAPADVPIDDDILPEPPGVLPTAVAPIVAPSDVEAGGDELANGAATDDEATNGEATNGEASESKIDAIEAANGVREILLRMNKEKRQQEAAAKSQS
ncbi:MAG: hypothetical protein ACTSX7_16695 [Alphaproteobacteria bacterium]